eukprot:gene680-1041_t
MYRRGARQRGDDDRDSDSYAVYRSKSSDVRPIRSYVTHGGAGDGRYPGDRYSAAYGGDRYSDYRDERSQVSYRDYSDGDSLVSDRRPLRQYDDRGSVPDMYGAAYERRSHSHNGRSHDGRSSRGDW